MKKIRQGIKDNPARFYLLLFFLMILSAMFLYPLAETDGQAGMGLFLAVIVLANTAAMLI